MLSAEKRAAGLVERLDDAFDLNTFTSLNGKFCLVPALREYLIKFFEEVPPIKIDNGRNYTLVFLTNKDAERYTSSTLREAARELLFLSLELNEDPLDYPSKKAIIRMFKPEKTAGYLDIARYFPTFPQEDMFARRVMVSLIERSLNDKGKAWLRKPAQQVRAVSSKVFYKAKEIQELYTEARHYSSRIIQIYSFLSVDNPLIRRFDTRYLNEHYDIAQTISSNLSIIGANRLIAPQRYAVECMRDLFGNRANIKKGLNRLQQSMDFGMAA